MNYYTAAIKKYAEFNGRSSRAEYWYFFLFNLIIGFVLGLIEGSNESMFSNLYSLFVFLPSIAVGVRRMHDISKSGWYIIIPIYNIILFASKGDKGVNKYGKAPQADNSEIDNSDKNNKTEMTKYCSKCGASVEGDSKFCIKCGGKTK